MLRILRKVLHTVYSENTIFGIIFLALLAFFLELFPLGNQLYEFKSSIIYIFVIVIILEVYFIRIEILKMNNLMGKKYDDVEILRNIQFNSEIDEEFYRLYEHLKRQISELASGRYRIESLNKVYKNDIDSINNLKENEELLSTCPVAPSSEKAIRQINNPGFRASIEAHRLAVQRGVKVTRIYLFQNEDALRTNEIKQHLDCLEDLGIKVLVVLRNRNNVGSEIDFLVFGKRKVSIGLIDPDEPTCIAAMIDVNSAKVEEYRNKYRNLMENALSVNDALKSL
ncbi:MAG: hypothetical protein QNJ18_14150 [Xenococcaceae cyanobacterium MO_167.B52]|nr:hypothetical protein [Xenococcaceae cyanobacterium MO_167.B52]